MGGGQREKRIDPSTAQKPYRYYTVLSCCIQLDLWVGFVSGCKKYINIYIYIFFLFYGPTPRYVRGTIIVIYYFDILDEASDGVRRDREPAATCYTPTVSTMNRCNMRRKRNTPHPIYLLENHTVPADLMKTLLSF